MDIELHDDFSPEKIARSGQCFRVKRFPDDTYRFITRGHVLYLRERSPGVISAECGREEWDAVWRPYFDLDRSYRAVRERIPETDPFLKRAADFGAGLRVLKQDPWEMLVTFIASQRKSIPAIAANIEAVSERYGRSMETPYEKVFLFPEPEEMKDADAAGLSACGLGYRVPYVLDAVRCVTCGCLCLEAPGRGDGNTACSPEELRETLKQVKGVGDKVADCVALFAYGRTEAAPVDVWIRQVMDRYYGGKDPFAPYGTDAGILQQYAFYYAVSHRAETRSGI